MIEAPRAVAREKEIVLDLHNFPETYCLAETDLVFSWTLLTRSDDVPSLETKSKREALSLRCSQVLDGGLRPGPTGRGEVSGS